ncbi:MAG: hypothetical protein EZS28_033573 [Streblomastix strix]|uniref:Uncharacterized protein n=1 Tax=Streblomastix strix TaxID=222440 RepID=A0A5J4ULJ4_9EUKA|nr:MAG: hypothetical protein EZS28_033573 [Streblomastix strix]
MSVPRAHSEYIKMLQWYYLNSLLEKTIKLREDYVNNVFYTLTIRLKEKNIELRQLELANNIRTKLDTTVNSIQIQADKILNFAEEFTALSESLQVLRTGLQQSMDKIPCSDQVIFKEDDVLHALDEVIATLNGILPFNNQLSNTDAKKLSDFENAGNATSYFKQKLSNELSDVVKCCKVLGEESEQITEFISRVAQNQEEQN